MGSGTCGNKDGVDLLVRQEVFKSGIDRATKPPAEFFGLVQRPAPSPDEDVGTELAKRLNVKLGHATQPNNCKLH
jgi:hypothetical protein